MHSCEQTLSTHLWNTEGNRWQQIFFFFPQDWNRTDVESQNMELLQTCVNAWPNSKQLFFQWHWSTEWTQNWYDSDVCEWAFKVSIHGSGIGDCLQNIRLIMAKIIKNESQVSTTIILLNMPLITSIFHTLLSNNEHELATQTSPNPSSSKASTILT